MTAPAVVTPLALAETSSAAASGPGWWDVLSGLLLAVAGMWATWAQFIYPKLLERRARTAGTATPTAPAPAAAPTDYVGIMFRDQAQRLDDVLDELAAAHRKHARDAATMARLGAELAECRRQTCHHLHPAGGPP